MRLKKAWVVAKKDLSEFKANKQILLTLAIVPIIMSLLPVFIVVPMVGFLSEDSSIEPSLPLNIMYYYDDSEFRDSSLNNAWINNSNVYGGVINGSYVNNGTLVDVVVRSSLLDNMSVSNAVIIGCVIRNSHYEMNTTVLINTYTSGTTGGLIEDLRLLFDLFTHSLLMFVFFAMAVAMPTTIAAYSFVGEKTNKTLEPLMATPLTDSELLWGKYLAIFVPVMSLIILAFAIFTIVVDALTYQTLGYLLLPDVLWIIAIFVITPLICLVGISLNVLISSKVNDVRTAQQYSALIVFPFMMVFFLGPILTTLTIGLDYLLLTAVALLGTVVLLTWLSLRTFNREDVLTTWK